MPICSTFLIRASSLLAPLLTLLSIPGQSPPPILSFFLQCRYYPNVNPDDETPGEWGRWISIALNITESERLKTEPEDLGISHAQKWEPKETKAAQA